MTALPDDSRRVAVITGGSGTVGAAVAERFAVSGLSIALQWRTREVEANACCETLASLGVRAVPYQAELEDPEAVTQLFTRVRHDLGTVSILVNCVGREQEGIVLRGGRAEDETILGANLLSLMSCVRVGAIDMVRGGWGRIVNVASVAALIGHAGLSSYAAAKAGVVGFSRSVARELGRSGVTVNVVAPGLILGSGAEARVSARARGDIVSRSATGRFVTAGAVADAVAFFCSEVAGDITGQVLAVDGGMTA